MNQVPESSRVVNLVKIWRERILQIILLIVILPGIAAYIYNMVLFIKNRQWGLAIVGTIVVTWMTLATFIPNISYNLKIISLLVTMTIFLPFSIRMAALSGYGAILILFYIGFATLMLGIRAGIYTTLISMIIYTLMGIFFLSGSIPMPAEEILLNSYSPSGWVMKGLVLFFTSGITAATIGFLLRGLHGEVSSLQEELDSADVNITVLEETQTALQNRATTLEKRLIQIRTTAEITRSISSEMDMNKIFQTTVDLTKERFDLYYAGIFLLDERRRFAELVAATGDAGQQMLAANHKLAVGGNSMIGWTTANKRARIAMDIGQEAVHFSNPFLPNTRSELALPIIHANEVLGAMTIQSTEEGAFDEDDIMILQTIADSLAGAISNAHLFQDIQNAYHEMNTATGQVSTRSLGDLLKGTPEISYSASQSALDDLLDSELHKLEVPLTLRGNQKIGEITLETKRQDLMDDERQLLEAITAQTSVALESAKLLEDSQRRVDMESTLNELSEKFSSALDFEELLKTIVSELGQIPQVGEASIIVKRPE